MYRHVVRPILFAMQPESAHNLMRVVGRVANVPALSTWLNGCMRVQDARLRVELAGMTFDNPIGMASGPDKDCELLGLWRSIGFGHVELGGVTAKPQPGNPKPRMFRLVEDQALINRAGFPSSGADRVAERLAALRSRLPVLPPLGMNIGKSKVTEIDQAVEDYSYSFSKVAPFVEYVTVNVSSPNTVGLRQLQERHRLLELLKQLQSINTQQRPLFVKVAPDLTFEALDEVIECCYECGVAGIVATNTTLSREGLKTSINEAGGLSGAPLTTRSLEVVTFIGSRLAAKTGSRIALIGVGGISSYQHVLAMLAAGAQMVQLYTALVYYGPGIVRRLNLDLVRYMDTHGCRSLDEAAQLWKSGVRELIKGGAGQRAAAAG